MFQVLIVDDESSVVHSLAESIAWEELGLRVAGTANNGLDAMTLVEEKVIDIAILDIRMPGINGLELCERLKMKNEQIQVIIISGYAEFAYAEKAIQYGVIGYCLKPLEYTQVMKFLRKAVQNLKSMRHISMHEDLMEILESQNAEKIAAYLKKYGLPDGRYYAAVSMGETKAEAFDPCLSFRLGRDQWGYLSGESLWEKLADRREKIGRQRGIGCIKHSVTAENLYGAFEDCIAMAYQFFVDETCRICTELDENKANRWIDAVRSEINSGRLDRAFKVLKTIEKEGVQDFTVRSSMRLCNQILTIPVFLNEEYIYSIEQLVASYGTLRNMLNILGELWKGEKSADSQQPLTNIAFMKLMKYVNENYRSDISLSSAAEALYMNPNYVSQLFKKAAGVNFVHYVNQKRLEDAKVLLQTTEKPVTDIAIEVGFNDYFYFMKTFKKFIGVTPGQYRAKN